MSALIAIPIWALALYCCLRWLRWNTRLPLGSREQDVRAVMRRGTQADIAYAIARSREPEVEAFRRGAGW